MKRFWLSGVALAITCSVAFAQPAEKVAEGHFNRGNTAYNLGRFDEAVAHFTKAYEAWPRPEFLYNIAQSYRLASNCKQALHFYKRFRSLKDADAANPLSPTKREEVDRFISQLTECAAKAETTAGAQPDTIDHPSAGGARPAGAPGAQARQPDEESADDEADEADGDGQSPSSARSMKIAGIVTGGAGLGLVVTGAVFGMMASKAQSDIEDAVKNNRPYDPDLDARGRRNSTISTVTFGLGAAAVVAGGVLFYLGSRDSSPSTATAARLRLTPTVSSQTAGLTLQVRY
jgi:tetratricopeptide (TPR) repeat protein